MNKFRTTWRKVDQRAPLFDSPACFLVLTVAVGSIPGCKSGTGPAAANEWQALAAERWYTCGLSQRGEPFCWGGVAGFREPPDLDSIPPNSAVPLAVPGGNRFIEISVGESIMCGLSADRTAYCWGINGLGGVGDGTLIAKRAPSAVAGEHRWLAVSAGSGYACGVTVHDEAYCWGNQFRGKLGNGEIDRGAITMPNAVLGGIRFSTIHASVGHTCALTPQGAAYCWGVNDNGRLGDGEPPAPGKTSSLPIKVVGGLRFVVLSLGANHTCGIADDQRAYCWGSNGNGLLGNGNTENTSIPTPVSGDLRWKMLAAGASHTCGITADGALYCWGGN